MIDDTDEQGAQRCCLIETHSEMFVLRLLRRIRETTEYRTPQTVRERIEGPNLRYRMSHDKLAVVFVEMDEHGIQLKKIRVDNQGEFIDRWPHGFFEERAEELFGP